jgi:hypothetical protein
MLFCIGHAPLHAEVRSVAAILLLSSSVIVAVGRQQGLPFDWAGAGLVVFCRIFQSRSSPSVIISDHTQPAASLQAIFIY